MADLARENATLGNGGRNPQRKSDAFRRGFPWSPGFCGESGLGNSDFGNSEENTSVSRNREVADISLFLRLKGHISKPFGAKHV